MKVSESGKKLIKDFEGLRLKAYKDSAGVMTIGYGHTGKLLPNTITKSKAEEFFESDVVSAEKKVNKYHYNYTQNQFDALVSFAFNIGNIDQLTANGTRTLDEILEKIPLYVYAGGVKSTGLEKRRKAEYELFSSDYSIVNTKVNTNNSTIKLYLYKKHANSYLSKNFQVKEFIAKGSPLRDMYERGVYFEVFIDDKLVGFLQRIRDHYGKPIIITSGYRPKEYNKSVNGATSSLHIEGCAADIRIDGVTPKELAAYCKSIGVKGIGTYDDFVHMDTRENVYYWKG